MCTVGGLEGMVDHGAEGFAIERLEVEVMHDAHGQRGVLLHAQMSRQGRQSYQPQSEQIAAIKGEVQEGGEIDEEGIGEMLCLVQNEDRCDASICSLCGWRSEEHTSELQSQSNLVCRLLLEKK